jgi:PIN domain nuclease of toxin-antitoxin system
MTRPLYSLDTHTLFWYEVADPKLSPNAASVFAEAELGRAVLVLNPVVLGEFYYTLRKFGLEAGFPAYLALLERNPIYRLEPITWDDFRRLHDFAEIPEMHDRLIAIQAVRLGAVLLTKDRTIQASPKVRWLW